METNILGIRISIFLDFGLLARFRILPAGGVWGGMRAGFFKSYAHHIAFRKMI
jgi:hypothetical protein